MERCSKLKHGYVTGLSTGLSAEFVPETFGLHYSLVSMLRSWVVHIFVTCAPRKNNVCGENSYGETAIFENKRRSIVLLSVYDLRHKIQLCFNVWQLERNCLLQKIKIKPSLLNR